MTDRCECIQSRGITWIDTDQCPHLLVDQDLCTHVVGSSGVERGVSVG